MGCIVCGFSENTSRLFCLQFYFLNSSRQTPYRSGMVPDANNMYLFLFPICAFMPPNKLLVRLLNTLLIFSRIFFFRHFFWLSFGLLAVLISFLVLRLCWFVVVTITNLCFVLYFATISFNTF